METQKRKILIYSMSAKLTLTILLSCIFHVCFGQSMDIPTPGQPCPDFIFTDVDHYPQKKVRLEDFRGKWLIIDFWSKYCGSCIASFPKLDGLRRKYENNVNFLMVATIWKNDKQSTKALFERYREEYDMKLPIAYDTVKYKNWDINGVPHIIVIDPNGIVKDIGVSITDSDIKDFLQDEVVKLKKGAISMAKISQKRTKTSFESQNDQYSTVYLSKLSKWNPEIPTIQIPSGIGDTDKIEIYGASLSSLYSYAYLGRAYIESMESNGEKGMYPRLIFDSGDGSTFTSNQATGKNIYCYTLMLPEKMLKNNIMLLMQQDLKRAFGHNLIIEERELPCLSLVLKDGKIASFLSTKESKSKCEITPLKIELINQKMSVLLKALNNNFKSSHLPIYDQTGIAGNIDLSLETFIYDYDKVKSSLNNMGLDLVEDKIRIKSLVVYN